MNQDRSTSMEEETPTLRSIAIGGPRTTLPPLSRSFPLPGKLPSRPLHVQSSPKPAIAGTPWTVDAILPAISADYMLERTNVYINNSSSQQVADRIVASLSSQSISYKKNEETKVRLVFTITTHCGAVTRRNSQSEPTNLFSSPSSRTLYLENATMVLDSI